MQITVRRGLSPFSLPLVFSSDTPSVRSKTPLLIALRNSICFMIETRIRKRRHWRHLLKELTSYAEPDKATFAYYIAECQVHVGNLDGARNHRGGRFLIGVRRGERGRVCPIALPLGVRSIEASDQESNRDRALCRVPATDRPDLSFGHRRGSIDGRRV